MTPEQRSLRARIAVHKSWARTPNRAARTAAARRNGPGAPADAPYWLNRVDPEQRMSESDRLAAAENARAAYYLERVAAMARARRKGAA